MASSTRRAFLGHLGATATVGIFAKATAAHAADQPLRFAPDERWLWQMLGDVEVGAPFHDDWYLVDAYPPMAGGATLVIAKGRRGDPLRVDVVRRGDPVRAPAATSHLELYAMDGGGGVRILPHELVDAMRALADQLGDQAAQARLSRRLMTHTERVESYPDFMARAAADLAPQAPDNDLEDILDGLRKLRRK